MQLFANVMLVLGIIALVIVSTYSMVYQLIHGNGGQHAPFIPEPPPSTLNGVRMARRTYRPHIRAASSLRKYLGWQQWICEGYGFSGCAATPKLAYDNWYQKFIRG